MGIIAAKPLFSSISIFAKNVPEVDRLFPLSDGYFGRFFPVFHEKFSLRTKLYSREALFLATFRDFRPLRRLTDFFNLLNYLTATIIETFQIPVSFFRQAQPDIRSPEF